MVAVVKEQVQTADGRLAMLEGLVADLNQHLETVPGAVLPPELRLAVARCARDALFCQACAGMQGTCFPKFLRFYDILKETKFDKPIQATASFNDKTAAIVTLIVHAVVQFQGKLNSDWYTDCLQAIKESGLVDASKYDDGEKKEEAIELACYSAISEIIILTAMSHGIHMLYQAIDKPVPKLTSKAAANGPTYLDLTKVLKRWHQDPKTVCAAPYYTKKDLNVKSDEFQTKLQEDTQKFMPDNLKVPLPVVGLCTFADCCVLVFCVLNTSLSDLICVASTSFIFSDIAPDDFTFYFRHYMRTVYLDQDDMFSSLFGKLNHKKHCPTVSRNDLETVASAVAGTHECDF